MSGNLKTINQKDIRKSVWWVGWKDYSDRALWKKASSVLQEEKWETWKEKDDEYDLSQCTKMRAMLMRHTLVPLTH